MKKEKRNRFVEDDPDSLIWSSSVITDEEKKRAEEILKEMPGEVNHDFSDMDIINKWVIAHDIGGDSFLEEARQKYGGNSLIGFVYVDHQVGISLEIETFCTVGADGDITPTQGPHDHNESLKLRYGILKPMKIELLNQDQIKSLSLSEKPEWLKSYDDLNLERTRQLEFLHPFRAPGFPDDIQVLLPPVKGKREEVVWARIESYSDDGVFVCTLLNQPNQDFKINFLDRIEVVPATIGDERWMLCKTVIDKYE